MGLRVGLRCLGVEILQPFAEARSEPLLEMDRSLHVGLGIADDRPPGAGGDGNVLAAGQRQRVEHDIGHLLDAARGACHGGHPFELQIWRRCGEQDGKNVVACRIDVENDAFHVTPWSLDAGFDGAARGSCFRASRG